MLEPSCSPAGLVASTSVPPRSLLPPRLVAIHPCRRRRNSTPNSHPCAPHASCFLSRIRPASVQACIESRPHRGRKGRRTQPWERRNGRRATSPCRSAGRRLDSSSPSRVKFFSLHRIARQDRRSPSDRDVCRKATQRQAGLITFLLRVRSSSTEVDRCVVVREELSLYEEFREPKQTPPRRAAPCGTELSRSLLAWLRRACAPERAERVATKPAGAAATGGQQRCNF